jgi:hypothetical protein
MRLTFQTQLELAQLLFKLKQNINDQQKSKYAERTLAFSPKSEPLFAVCFCS